MSTATETLQGTPQWQSALDKANAVYRGHAELKREVRSGSISVLDALGDPRAKGNLSIGKLLAAQRRWGPQKTSQFLWRTSINSQRRVDQLTERQVEMVRQAMRERALRAVAKGRRPAAELGVGV